MIPYKPLQIMAEDRDDLHVIAACLQDALIPLSGMEYDKEKGQFYLVANRFCWECDPESVDEKMYYPRVATGLSFHHVEDVQLKDLDLHNRNELVNLLTIHHENEEQVHLIFSGGSEIKLKIHKVCCHLKDMDEPYPTLNKPCHFEEA